MKREDKTNAHQIRSLMTSSLAASLDVVVTHPLWTIKSKLQSNEPIPGSMRGLYAFYRDPTARATRLAISITVVGETTQQLEKFFTEYLGL